MFLAWFEANKREVEGRDLTYAEFLTRFVYYKDLVVWKLRKKGNSIGRLTYIPHDCREVYYLRLLLTIQKGCTSYNDVKTMNGVVYKSFKEACFALGLLDDDREFIHAIIDASEVGTRNQLRRLFVTLLVMNSMTNPFVVWESTWKYLSDGILYERRKSLNYPGTNIYLC